MAKPARTNILLDWFTVSYRSLGLVLVAVVAIAVVAWLLWPSAARADAEDAIKRARDKLTEASQLTGDEKLEEVKGSARAALDEASSAFEDKSYERARQAAMQSENWSRKAIDMAKGEGAPTGEVRFYKLEGDVRVKRAGEFNWESADAKMTIRVGDQVKTASSASVQLIYFDGTITTIQPGSLLEVRELREDPATKVRRVKEKLNWGEIVASTQKRNVEGSFHEVATEKAAARSEEAGEFRVAYDNQTSQASFDVFEGRVQVSSADRKETLAAGERMRASPEGKLQAKEVLPGVPRLVAPSDQRIFVYEDPTQATTNLSWEKVPGGARYHLIISDRFLFTEPLYDAEREDTSVVIDGIAPGAYYWKVAAVSPSGVRGPFCEPRRFRVTSHKIRDREDTTPPRLEVTDFVQTGPMVIMNGRTEPGAQLWVDNEKVDVYDDGTFYAVIRLRKEGANDVQLLAQDAAGNEARLTKRAYVEQY